MKHWLQSSVNDPFKHFVGYTNPVNEVAPLLLRLPKLNRYSKKIQDTMYMKLILENM